MELVPTLRSTAGRLHDCPLEAGRSQSVRFFFQNMPTLPEQYVVAKVPRDFRIPLRESSRLTTHDVICLRPENLFN